MISEYPVPSLALPKVPGTACRSFRGVSRTEMQGPPLWRSIRDQEGCVVGPPVWFAWGNPTPKVRVRMTFVPS